MSATALAVSFVGANILGVWASRELDRWKRLQFLALHTEKGLRDDLELAMAEIRTLHGIIPICGHCKRVRDDMGKWHAVDEYVPAHTHAEFAHGLCQWCVADHYPEALSRS